MTRNLLALAALTTPLLASRAAQAKEIYNPLHPEEAAAPTIVAAPEKPAPRVVDEGRPNALQLDLGLAVIGLAYERFFERRIAVQFEGHIFGTWFGPIVDLPNLIGFGGQVRPSFFLTQDGPRGVYVAPFVRVERVTAEVNGETKEGKGYSTGVFVGYGFLVASRVNVRVGPGLQYMSYVVDPQGSRTEFRSFFPAIDLVVGYVF